MIIIKSKRIGVNWRVQLLDNEIRILDFKRQLVFKISFKSKNADINVYRYLTSVKKIKLYIRNYINVQKIEMR